MDFYMHYIYYPYFLFLKIYCPFILPPLLIFHDMLCKARDLIPNLSQKFFIESFLKLKAWWLRASNRNMSPNWFKVWCTWLHTVKHLFGQLERHRWIALKYYKIWLMWWAGHVVDLEKTREHTKFYLENIKRNNYLGDIVLDIRKEIRICLKKIRYEVVGLVWCRQFVV